MKKVTAFSLFMAVLVILCAGVATAGNIKSAGVYGPWSATTTWVGGVLPGQNDTVTIANGDTVTYDMVFSTNTAIAGLIVGEGTSGILQFCKPDSTKLTINGDLLIKKGAIFKVQSKSPVVAGVFGNQHLIQISGNLTYVGAIFTCRTGSAGSSLSVANFEFIGSGNSVIAITPDTSKFFPNFSLNGLTINKSGTGKVTLGSNVYMVSGSTSAAYHSARLTFIKGKVYTGDYTLATTTSTNANFSGASDSSYVVGCMGRANSSGGTTREWFIGDTKGYRPVKIRMTTGLNTGHWVAVRAIEGNANTGSSTFAGDIDKVTSIRYYKVDYLKGTLAVDSVRMDKFTISFGQNDGVKDSSRNLRIAYSTDARAKWTGLGPVLVPDTAIFAYTPPLYIESDSLAPANNLTMKDAGPSLYLAMARATGTTDNTLDAPSGQAVRNESGVPAAYTLGQNYPNPFNPSTNVTYSIARPGFVSLKVYDLIGREVATFVNEVQQAGTYTATWNAVGMSSGIYFYQMKSGSFGAMKKMILIK